MQLVAGGCYAWAPRVERVSRIRVGTVDARTPLIGVRPALQLALPRATPAQRARNAVAVDAPCADAGSPSNWWPGDCAGRDTVTGRCAALLGGADVATGLVGTAFDLDGVDGEIDLGDSAGAVGTGDFSVDLWVRLRSGSECVLADRIGADPSDSTEEYGWSLSWLGSSTVRFALRSGRNVAFVDARTALDDGRWHHLAVVRELCTLTVYTDGEPGATSVAPLLDLAGEASLRLGHRARARIPLDGHQLCWRESFGFLDGLLDEVAFHARALSADEVARVFAAGSTGRCAD